MENRNLLRRVDESKEAIDAMIAYVEELEGNVKKLESEKEALGLQAAQK